MDIDTIGLMVLLCLAGCDLGNTKLGELPEPGTPTEEHCSDEWQLQPLVEERDRTVVDAILPLDDGFILGGTPTSASVSRTDISAVETWAVEIAGGAAFVKGLAATPSGDYIAVAQAVAPAEPSGEELWIGGISADGQLQWEGSLGTAHFMAWMTADIVPHPDGGFVVGWHASGREGAAQRDRLARINDQGDVQWEATYPLAPGSNIAISWSRGATDILPGGDIIQLTADRQEGLRLLRTTAQGQLASDAIIENVAAWPQDLLVLPDGAILVLAYRAESGAILLEVDASGTVNDTYTNSTGTDPNLTMMAYDPLREHLYLGGTTRDSNNSPEQQWSLVLDRQLNELFTDLRGGNGSGIRAVAAAPTGGFLASRHNINIQLESVVAPCD